MARSKKAEREHLRRQMLADGVPVAQIAIEMGRRFRARPRTAWRYALGWDQWKAVQEYRTANSVAIDESRISRWESWPHGGTRPSPENLVGGHLRDDRAKFVGLRVRHVTQPPSESVCLR